MACGPAGSLSVTLKVRSMEVVAGVPAAYVALAITGAVTSSVVKLPRACVVSLAKSSTARNQNHRVVFAVPTL